MLAMMTTLKVSDFSRYPGGRVESQGPKSGERYREEIFEPAIQANANLTIDLRNLEILLPSFVDEAFGPYCQRVGKMKFQETVNFIYPFEESQAEFFVNQMINRRAR